MFFFKGWGSTEGTRLSCSITLIRFEQKPSVSVFRLFDFDCNWTVAVYPQTNIWTTKVGQATWFIVALLQRSPAAIFFYSFLVYEQNTVCVLQDNFFWFFLGGFSSQNILDSIIVAIHNVVVTYWRHSDYQWLLLDWFSISLRNSLPKN